MIQVTQERKKSFSNFTYKEAFKQLGREIAIYGIVTNGEGWKFYRLQTDGTVSESLLHGIGEMSILLGCCGFSLGCAHRI